MSFWKCTLTYAGREIVQQRCPNFTGDLVGHIAADTETQARQEAAADIVETMGISPKPSNPKALIDALDTPTIIACEEDHG